VRTLIGPSPHPQHPKSFEVIRSSSDSFRARSPKAKVYFESRSDTTLLGTTTTISPFSPPPPPPPIQRSGADDWSHMQLVIALVFLSVLAVAAANFFIKERIRNDLTRSQAEAQHLQTEIRLLRSQVNPHFLFNTLNNLFSMAQRKGNDQLADSISKLSGMMRYMIYESDTDAVPLQREISYLDDCIALNKLRYADSEVAVSFSHPAPAIAAAISIAPMLFVPFLENAFKHGVSIGSHTRIDMDISVEQKKLIFTCENIDYSGVKKLEEEKGGIGLENVRRRLELLYPGRHELRAGAAQGKYTVNLQIELA
jgi:two-component system, LytTR family, sensor kinase